MTRYHKVLVPFSGLPLPEQFYTTAVAVAKAMAAELVLLRVNPPDQNGERLYAELKVVKAQLADCEVPVTITVLPGPAEDAILSCATENEVDLIITDRDGDGDPSGMAERLFRQAHCATLFTPAIETS